MGSALRRAGQPFAGAKGRWQRFAEAVGSSPDARWGRPLGGVRMGPSGVVATATRRKGPGGVCWKRRVSGLPTFDARRGLVGRGGVRWVDSARKTGKNEAAVCQNSLAPARLLEDKIAQLKQILAPQNALPRPRSSSHRSRLPGPSYRCSAGAYQRRSLFREQDILTPVKVVQPRRQLPQLRASFESTRKTYRLRPPASPAPRCCFFTANTHTTPASPLEQ